MDTEGQTTVPGLYAAGAASDHGEDGVSNVISHGMESAIGGFRAGKPQLLFEDTYDRGVSGYANYDVLGKEPRLLMIKSEPRPAPTRLDVVQGWFVELRRLGPGGLRTP